jgi:protein-disulfide isomerase
MHLHAGGLFAARPPASDGRSAAQACMLRSIRSGRWDMRRRQFAGFALLACGGFALPAAAEFNPRQARRQLGQLIETNQSPTSGGPGPVTVVEFFDYQCPSCKATEPHLRAALAASPQVRLIYKEFPNLGSLSTTAAHVALAAGRQGRYEAVHRGLFDWPDRLTRDRLFEIAAAQGVAVDQLRSDMEADDIRREIADTGRLARRLGIDGTPIFLIGGPQGEDAVMGGLGRSDFIEKFRTVSATR